SALPGLQILEHRLAEPARRIPEQQHAAAAPEVPDVQCLAVEIAKVERRRAIAFLHRLGQRRTEHELANRVRASGHRARDETVPYEHRARCGLHLIGFGHLAVGLKQYVLEAVPDTLGTV